MASHMRDNLAAIERLRRPEVLLKWERADRLLRNRLVILEHDPLDALSARRRRERAVVRVVVLLRRCFLFVQACVQACM